MLVSAMTMQVTQLSKCGPISELRSLVTQLARSSLFPFLVQLARRGSRRYMRL
jgi:hypothetical protein